jgi:hypothetical protein
MNPIGRSIETIDPRIREDFGTDPLDAEGYVAGTIVNTASLVSVTDGVSWKRIRTFAVVVAGPGTFHRYHPVSSAWVAILIQVVPLSVV